MQCRNTDEYNQYNQNNERYGNTFAERESLGRSARRFYPVVTWILLALNILFFVWLEWNGSTNNGYFMAQHGTLVPFMVLEEKEYYRLVTAVFMHFGFSHLFNNMLLLWYLGMRLEKYIGHISFALTYLACGLGGNLASLGYYALTEPFTNSAGASGAVFGIVGAMLWIVLRHRGHLADLTTRQLMLMIVFTLYNGFTSSGINNVAHVVGLVLGFLLGMLFYRGGSSIFKPKKQEPEDIWYDLS